MDGLIEVKLEKDLLSNELEYFFTFLCDRFEYAVELWIKELEKKFNKKFKPIWILSSKQNDLFKKENFIIINRLINKFPKENVDSKLVCQEEPEDLNKYFSESEFIKGLIEKLVRKQGRVFILPWTSSCLKAQNPQAIILGPGPDVAKKYDNKITQVELFNELGLLRNKVQIYNNFKELKKNVKFPSFISASYTSGGFENGVINSKDKLDEYYTRVREENKGGKFISARLIEDVKHSPNVNAIVFEEGKTEIICISDQILRGCKYLGNIYPSIIDKKSKKAIIETTKIVGNHLSKKGFKGVFGLDFIIDSRGNLYTIDLNPRRQGGYVCNILMALPKVSLIELELKLALNEKIKNIPSYEDFQVDYVWAHLKLKPYYDFMKIVKITNKNRVDTPFLEI